MSERMLYRYLDLRGFLALITQSQEMFVHPYTWRDKYEGYLFGQLADRDVCRRIIQHYLTQISKCENQNDAANAVLHYMRLLFASRHYYGKCWTTLAESDAMWRIYGDGGQGVRICVSENTLRSIVTKIPGYEINIEDVVYDLQETDDLGQKQIEQMAEEDSILQPYFHKRPAFEHEKEVRAIITTASHRAFENVEKAFYFGKQKFQECANQEEWIEEILRHLPGLREEICKREGKKDDCLLIPIPNLAEYLVSVEVHPLAEPWHVESIQKLCGEYGVRCIGQSLLYRDPRAKKD